MWSSTLEFRNLNLRGLGWTEINVLAAHVTLDLELAYVLREELRSLDQRLSAMEMKAAASGREARSSGPCE